jgi:hypothetical protein
VTSTLSIYAHAFEQDDEAAAQLVAETIHGRERYRCASCVIAVSWKWNGGHEKTKAGAFPQVIRWF